MQVHMLHQICNLVDKSVQNSIKCKGNSKCFGHVECDAITKEWYKSNSNTRNYSKQCRSKPNTQQQLEKLQENN